MTTRLLTPICLAIAAALLLGGAAADAKPPCRSAKVACAPVNLTLPSMSGTVQDGQILTVSSGTWSGTQPIGYSYQWDRCDRNGAACVPQSGATSTTYGVGPTDVGSVLRAVVTASNISGSSAATSAPTQIVANAAPPIDATPPSQPANLIVSGSGTSVAATWSASTDNVGVIGYTVYVDGVSVATVAATTFTATGLSCGSSHTLAVEAFDAAGNASSRASSSASTTACSPPPSTGPCGVTSTVPATYKHVIWIWMENKLYSTVIGAPSAPYENALAAACGLATNYHGVTHPSLPNYIAATSGDYWGIADDNAPSSHPLAVASIYSQLTGVGKTWRDYQEGAPGNCPLSSSGTYAVKHDPAPYYTSIRTDCARWDVPMGSTTSGNFLTDLANDALPDFSFVTPNLCNDTHDCAVSVGDAWLQSWLPKIFASNAYKAGQTAVFLVWDENDGSAGNQVPLIVASPSTVPATTSSTSYSHYSLLRTTEQMLGITTFLGHAGDPTTAGMANAFQLLP